MKTIKEMLEREDLFSEEWWNDFFRGKYLEPAGSFSSSDAVMSEYAVKHLVLQLIEELQEDVEK